MEVQGIKIESGIPIQEGRGRPKAQTPYEAALSVMTKGQSFVVDGKNINTINSAIRNAARSVGVKVVVRKIVLESDENCVRARVWHDGLIEDGQESK